MVSIKVQEASIKTASVEIRALTVSGKQVTMGLFRQLVDEDIVDQRTGLLRGVPWGTVNYFFGPCRNDHTHIVWQQGDELRRACALYDDDRRRIERLFNTEKSEWGDAVNHMVHVALWRMYHAGDIQAIEEASRTRVLILDTGQWTVRRDWNLFESDYGSYGCECPLPGMRKEYTYPPSDEFTLALADKAAKLLANEVSLVESLKEIDNGCAVMKDLDVRRDKAVDAYKSTAISLRELPQLFIAV